MRGGIGSQENMRRRRRAIVLGLRVSCVPVELSLSPPGDAWGAAACHAPRGVKLTLGMSLRGARAVRASACRHPRIMVPNHK